LGTAAALAALLITLALTALPLRAASPIVDDERLAVVLPAAPVLLDDTLLFEVYGVMDYPAEVRAGRIQERLEKIAADRRVRPGDIVAVEGEMVTFLNAGPERIMGILDLDASTSGVPRRVLAETYLEKIRAAVEKYRADRTAASFAQAVRLALLATAALLAAILTLRLLRRALLRRIEARYHARIASLTFKSIELLRAERIWTAIVGALRLLSLTAALVAVFAYLDFVLGLFPQTRLLSVRLLDYLLSPLAALGRALIGLVPNLLFLAVVAALTRYILKFLRLFFTEVGRGRIELAGFQPEWALPVYGLVRIAVVAFALVVAFPYIPGSSSPAFQGVTIFLGAVVSLGSTGVFGNLLAGYTLIFQRSFALGDRVRIGEVVGDVVETSLLVTRVRTIKNEVVTVPNSAIVGGQVVNYSSLARKGGLILHTAVTIGYDTPWRQVEALLIAAAEKTPQILREPAPFVLQTALGDFYVHYELNAYTDRPARMIETYADLHRNVLDSFNEYGVQITSPNYVLDPKQAKIVPRERWYEAPARPPEAERPPGTPESGGTPA
jgi:small-conductance mechanosensitive channel